MAFKDHFSGHAAAYADARPSYPEALFTFLTAQCEHHDLAWDCATGNGQAATSLAKHFKRVIATDGSAQQVQQAQPADNIEYRQMTAETKALEEGSCDLITVAQALHWFDRDAFFANVKACLKPQGALAVWCYGVHTINAPVDAVFGKLYEDILGEYWPPERRLVENQYQDIKFPFKSVTEHAFVMTRDWNLQQLCGYFTSWSALQRYKNKNHIDPLDFITDDLQTAWGKNPAQTLKVTWPLSLRLARM